MNQMNHIAIFAERNREQESSNYIGPDGLLYCGTCHTPEEAYFPEGKTFFGCDRHPAECDCQRKRREAKERVIKEQEHLQAVSRLKGEGIY